MTKANEKVYDVITTKQFESDVKYYIRKKKFTHIIDDIESVTSELEKGNLIGDVIPGLSFCDGEHTIKVRAANTDTKSSKSDGYRIIYYVIKDDKEIYLLTIYYKKDDNKIPTNKEIEGLVRMYCLSEEKQSEEYPS
jgi:mRNA-degrading endonuclease RelE of RelBE toxin-antitoxin system